MDKVEALLPLSSPALASSNLQTGTSTSTSTSTTTATTTPRSYPPTPTRLATFLALLVLSLWANYEASKGFTITILKAPAHTLAGRRFDLLFVSNGKAEKMALKSSTFIEGILYPREEAFPRKPVRHVTIRLSDRNITSDVLVTCREHLLRGEYLIEISSSLMARKDVITRAVASALHRGMAYVWLWDGHGLVPQPIIDAAVEYLLVQYDLAAKHNEDSTPVSSIASLIQKCEERSNGFIARLNQAMAMGEKWDEHTLIDAFGSPSDVVCLSRIISASDTGSLPNLQLNQVI